MRTRMMTIGLLALAAMMAGGCVGSGKYEQAVADAEEARIKADKVQLQKKALEEEVKGLRDQKNKLLSDSELASAELQRFRDSRDKERGSAGTRVQDLEQRNRDLATQNRALQQQMKSLKKQNNSLKGTVSRYQKALKEPPASMPKTAPALPKMPAAPAVAPAKPVPAAPAAPRAGPSPVNVNTASATDMVLFLGLTKNMADKIVANRPYKLRGGLMRVIPKTTYNAIKDRISVTP